MTPPATTVKKETPSLNLSAIHHEEEEEEEKIEEIKEQEAFTQEELTQVVKEFAEKRKEADASEMELLILNKRFELLDNFQVKLVLSNSIELSILERAEPELVQFLRKTLKNGQLKLQPEIKEVEEKDKLYTDRDKYEFMVQKNPELKKLKDKLGLDFEF